MAEGTEWTRFRGPNGSGIGEGEFPAEWKESDFAWKIELPGTGHGSPVVWGEKVFVLCGNEESGNRMPVCVNAADGSILWKVEFDPGNSKRHKFNSVASTTPAVDEEQVYFSWGNEDELTMVAFSHDGKKVWEQDLGPVSGGHGFGASPMVFGGLVVLNNDQEGVENGSLLALKEGMVSVIAATKEFKLLGQNDLGDVCRTAPAISGGRMFVRTFGKLFAVKGK